MLTKSLLTRLAIYIINPLYIKIILTIIRKYPKLNIDILTSIVIFVLGVAGISLISLDYFNIHIHLFEEVFLLTSQGSLTMYVCIVDTLKNNKNKRGGN